MTDTNSADLCELARLCNGYVTPAFRFNLDQPLALVPFNAHYWALDGRSVQGVAVRHLWPQTTDNQRPDFRAELNRCGGIEATDDPATALHRLLDLERSRAAEEDVTP
jgi:hypothetical protein